MTCACLGLILRYQWDWTRPSTGSRFSPWKSWLSSTALPECFRSISQEAGVQTVVLEMQGWESYHVQSLQCASLGCQD